MEQTTLLLSAWVKEYTEALYSWALHKTGDHHLAEDLVQDTFLSAAKSIVDFKGDSNPKTWLFAILKYKIAHHYRKSLRFHTLPLNDEFLKRFFEPSGRWQQDARPGHWPAADHHLLDDPDFTKVLDKCIELLPDAMHACIRLKFLEEKKGVEICRELGISPTYFWQLVYRAKLQLRQCLENHWFEKNQ